MTPNLLRGTLNLLGFAAPCWAIPVFWVHLGAAVTIVIAGMLCLIVAGLIERVEDE